jgi:hypothetical protein
VFNLINNDHFENVDVDALDSEITEDDIIKAIAKLREGYLRKIPVLRLNFPSRLDEVNLVSPLVFFANTPPKHDISVHEYDISI